MEVTKSVDFTRVQVTDEFWGARQKQFLCITVPTGIANVEKTGGGISNLVNAGKLNHGETHGEFEGALYVDSDVHKLVESMCYALQIDAGDDVQMIQAQENIRVKLEEWIPYYQAAQEEDGYFDTYFTLAHPNEKFTDFNLHELYCAGHMYEAAVAHYRMSSGSDTRLLDVAVKNADYICSLFGDGKWKAVPGHQEIELALLKLAGLCREIGIQNNIDYEAKAEDYVEMASFFLRTRGDHTDRHGTSYWPEGVQDYAPIIEQTEILSHCVRAHYMCMGMADLELLTGANTYKQALLTFWNSAQTKTYVTGAVGDQEHHEGYGPDYYMPLNKSYGETCGSVSSLMWNQRMNMLFGDSKYADEMEQQLYNAMLSGINLDGNRFFYHNYVSTAGRERVEWYGTACCPPNLMRAVLSLGGYIYTQQGDTVTMNLYIGNEADLSLTQGDIHLSVSSDFPWEGRMTMKVRTDGDRKMKLRLRLPSWATGENTMTVAGETIPVSADAQGYVILDRVWKNGDIVCTEFPMNVQSVDMVEGAEATVDYTAFRRGPIVYCAEKIDNEGDPKQYYIAEDAAFTSKWTDNLDGKEDPYGVRGMMVITTDEAKLPSLAKDEEARLTMIPYYANANRGSTPMEVYMSLIPRDQRLEYYGTPSASHTYAGNQTDSVSHLNDNDESVASRWSSYNDGEPQEDPWVMYSFQEPVSISGCKVLWYDDGGGVQTPESLLIEYWDGEKFVGVEGGSDYTSFPKNQYGTYLFSQVITTRIRMTMHNAKTNNGGGIVEWRLIGACKSVWNMEQLSDDLFEAGGASSYFPQNVGAKKADGKGVNGSFALAYEYRNIDGGNYWGNSIELSPGGQQGMDSDWSKGKLLWFWVDTGEFESQLSLDVWLNGVKPAEGTMYYLWDGWEVTESAALPEAYTGAGYGRIPLPKGYQGFVGVDLDGYRDLGLEQIHSLYFYFECSQDKDLLPKSLYLDEFWITDAGATPNVIIREERPPYSRMLWDMEELPEDLVAAGEITTWGSYGENIEAVKAVGKGVDGSTALGYRYLNCNPGAGGSDILLIGNIEGLGASKDFSDGELLWFWMDSSELPNAMRFDIYLNWFKVKTGAPAWLYNGVDEPTRILLTPAWDGQPSGRIDLPKGYVGYVGLRLKDFCSYNDQGQVTGILDAASVTNMFLYFGAEMDNSGLPATLYLDNFCLTDANSLPGECKHDKTRTEGAKAATCTEDGYTGDVYCTNCDKLLQSGTIIKATGHKHTNIVNAKAATEEQEGYTGDTYCTDCKTVVSAGTVIPKLAHTHNMSALAAKEATCTSEGNIAYWHCSKCKKYYSDENGATEISLSETVVPMKDHYGGTASCVEKAICSVCGQAYGELAAHDYVEKAESHYLKSAATCSSKAVYYKSCSVCGEKGTETFEYGDTKPEKPSDDTGKNDPQKPSAPGNEKDTEVAPKTGDTSMHLFWKMLVLAGGMLLALFGGKKIRAK